MLPVNIATDKRFPAPLALPHLPEVLCYDVPCDRVFLHRLSTSRPPTIDSGLVLSNLSSMPLLDVCIDGRLVTSDPYLTRRAIFLPATGVDGNLSIEFHQAVHEFFFIYP